MTVPYPLPDDLAAEFLDLDAEEGRYPSQISVYCDRCGVTVTNDYVVHTDMDRRARLEVAREHLRGGGWHCVGSEDLCPNCAPAAGPAEP